MHNNSFTEDDFFLSNFRPSCEGPSQLREKMAKNFPEEETGGTDSFSEIEIGGANNYFEDMNYVIFSKLGKYS